MKLLCDDESETSMTLRVLMREGSRLGTGKVGSLCMMMYATHFDLREKL